MKHLKKIANAILGRLNDRSADKHAIYFTGPQCSLYTVHAECFIGYDSI